MDSDTVTDLHAIAVYLAVGCYTGVGLCKWAPLWVVAAVLMALTPGDSHVGHGCDFVIRLPL